jgi:hypothetical protein
VPAADLAHCCDICNGDQKCVFYTFNPHGACGNASGCCHPKKSDAGRSVKPGVVSGRSVNAPPTPNPAPTPRHPTQPPTPPPSPYPPPPIGSKNILLMLADDLRPNIGYLHPFMQTPNIDKLAKRSMVFKRAYVQQQVCSPSRNSFMSGRRPDRTRTWNFIGIISFPHPRYLPFVYLYRSSQTISGYCDRRQQHQTRQPPEMAPTGLRCQAIL